MLAVSAPLAWAATAARAALESQLAAVRAPKGSALDRFIRANQGFSALRADEASDRLPIPLWLRAALRKSPPEGRFSAGNPPGGYPFVLKEAVEWMRHHPDLAPGPREADVAEPALRVAVGANVKISGPPGDAFNSDPTVDWTSDGVAWSTTIGINGSITQLRIRSFRSTDGGATWSLDGTVSGAHTSADKQIQWIDHSATSPFKDNIYVIWHNDEPAYVNRRTATSIRRLQQLVGIHGQILPVVDRPPRGRIGRNLDRADRRSLNRSFSAM
ncbi:MAG TPA: hypothetical protein VGS22_09550 [Thermoanaerobaculia bacterium]|jgi:hypothetical protein|nr:hypothetical protein [Thermoanaerobaculia bacterium]